jgi:hypothetical protein
MVARARRFFWGNVVGSGQRAAVDDGHELVFGPSVFVVVEALPEGGEPSLNLPGVRFVVAQSAWCTYLQLPYGRLAKVLGPGVDAQRDQIAAVDALFAQALLALLRP